MPPILRYDRPAVFLACLCLLEIHARMTYSDMSDLLVENFPEYGRVRPELLRLLYNSAGIMRPEWIRGIDRADTNGDEIHQMLRLVQTHRLGRRRRFTRDTRDGTEMIRYLYQLMGTSAED